MIDIKNCTSIRSIVFVGRNEPSGALSFPLPEHWLSSSEGFIAEDASDDLEGYKAITCLACQRTHLVNPTTGKVLGVDDE